MTGLAQILGALAVMIVGAAMMLIALMARGIDQ